MSIRAPERTSSRHRSAGRAPHSSSRPVTVRGAGLAVAADNRLSNARTRIVGDRTGILADVVVAAVRVGRAGGAAVLTALEAVRAVVTPLGWTLISLTVVGFVAGYTLGWVELVALAWASLVLIVIASGFLIGANAHRVELGMQANRVIVGARAIGQVAVANPTRRRLLGAALEIPVGDGFAALPLPSLAAGARFDDVFVVPTSARGVLRIGPVRTVRGDPIGVLRSEKDWEDSVELFVHPRTIGIPSTSTGFIRDLEGRVTRDLTSSDVAFHALREYQLGDDRRYIHWRSTAKQGVYMVRQFEETRRSHLMVALSLARADYATDEEFELAVSVAGSLGVRAIADARTVSVVASGSTPEFAKRKLFAVHPISTLSRQRLLDDLTRVQLADSALGIIDLARVSAQSVAGTSVAFLVLGSPVSGAGLRAAAKAFPAGVEVVAIICDPGLVPGLKRVGGLSVLTIGYLEDLQKALARSKAA